MGNKTRGMLDVAGADGKTVRLQFTTNAICEIEDAVGGSFFEFLSEFQAASVAGALPAKKLRLLLWGGMIEHQPEATLKDAGALIEAMGGIAPAMEKLHAALIAGFPEAAAAAGGDPGNVKAA